MGPLLDCARAHASEGEIIESLQQVFGDYARDPRLLTGLIRRTDRLRFRTADSASQPSKSTMKPRRHGDQVRHRRELFVGSLVVILASVTALAFASERIKAEQAAFYVPSAGRCTPSRLNRSAILPDSPIAVTPLPDSYDSLPRTQISFLGAPASELSKVVVYGSSSGNHTGSLRAYSQGDGASFVPPSPSRPGSG